MLHTVAVAVSKEITVMFAVDTVDVKPLITASVIVLVSAIKTRSGRRASTSSPSRTSVCRIDPLVSTTTMGWGNSFELGSD